MKKNLMLLFAAAVMLNSCGTAAHFASSVQEQRFQDGIYSYSQDRVSKSEKVMSKAKTDSLAALTKLVIKDTRPAPSTVALQQQEQKAEDHSFSRSKLLGYLFLNQGKQSSHFRITSINKDSKVGSTRAHLTSAIRFSVINRSTSSMGRSLSRNAS